MKSRDLLSVEDLSGKEILSMIDMAGKLKRRPLSRRRALKSRTFALLFQKPSNRTRVSFEVGIAHMGGYALYLSPQEIRMGERESVKDVARVMSRYVDGMVARVFSHDDLLSLGKYSYVPVINGLSDEEHPCQALGDLLTISERVKDLAGTTLSFVGDGNNVLHSLMLACAKVGVNLKVATPPGCAPQERIVSSAREHAAASGSRIELYEDPVEAVREADFVYTDVWVSMGEEAARDAKLEKFHGFQVNEALMAHAKGNAYIMHCLPAHRGEEIDDMIDSKSSIVYDQAENRMHAQKAVMLRIFRK